jgi:hypothetical protein
VVHGSLPASFDASVAATNRAGLFPADGAGAAKWFRRGFRLFREPAKAEMRRATDIARWTGIYGWDSYIFPHARAGLAGLDPATPDEVK